MAEVYSIEQQTISVSRSRARAYEEYERYYHNREGLFSELGKFLVKDAAGNALPQTARGLASLESKLKSSVDNLRNPVHRLVEFYATTLLSGDLEEALPFRAGEKVKDADKLKDAVGKIWEASNLSQSKQVLKRYTAIYGQCFIKVVRPEGKDYCYLQFVKPSSVTDFSTDDRGNVTRIRLDTPGSENAGTPNERKVWRSEVWSKGDDDEEGYALFATGERQSPDTVPSEEALAKDRSAKRYELGSASGFPFDFVPFVAVNAAATGEKRPTPVYAHGLALMVQLCKEATRLSDLLFRFNKAFKAVVGIGNDPSGRPLPPPKPDGVRDLGQMQREGSLQTQSSDGSVPFGGSRGQLLHRQEDISIEGVAVVGLPGTANVVDIAPNIDYGAAREWISDHLRELYEECPELLYYAVESRANQSGAALRTLISGALDRAQEMRSNILAGLVKADKMALTIAQLAGLEGFSREEIGTYEDGDFDHSFEVGEILPLREEEREQAKGQKVANAQSLMGVLTQLGIPREKQREVVLKELGYEEFAETKVEGQEPPEVAEGNEGIAAATRALQQRFDGGQRT